MATADNQDDELSAPLWIRRPEMLHLLAYTAAGFSFAGQIVATILRDADWRVVLALLLAGAGTALSWRTPTTLTLCTYRTVTLWPRWPIPSLTGAGIPAVSTMSLSA